jgi:hypothetical protein
MLNETKENEVKETQENNNLRLAVMRSGVRSPSTPPIDSTV